MDKPTLERAEETRQPAGIDDVNPRDLLQRLWRHKWLLLAVVILCMAPTWVYLQQITPRYTATALVLIEPPERHVVDMEAVVAGLTTDPETVHGELIVLRSRELALKVAGELPAVDLDRLLAPRQSAGPFDHIDPRRYLAQLWPGEAQAEGADAAPAAAPSTEDRLLAASGRLMAANSVETRQGTRVVELRYSFEDPELATIAANAHAETYVRHTLDVKYAGTREATAWLNDRLEELRLGVETSERSVEVARRELNLVRGRSTNLVAEEISQVNTQLVTAKAETAQMAARVRQAQTFMNEGGDMEALNGVLNAPAIGELRNQQTLLERRAAELSNEFGDKHPRMISIRTEIDGVQAKIQAEINRVVASMANELELARARQASLQASLDRLSGEIGELNEAEVELRALEREAGANRLLFETFLNRYKETSIQQDFQQPDARIVSRAEVPGGPSYPNKRQTLFGAFAVSLAFGLVLVFAIETLDKGFRTVHQVESQTGLRALGLIPATSSVGGRPEEHVLDNLGSRYAEAIRMLMVGMTWPGPEGAAPRRLLITSSLPREGKTTVATSLARLAAKMGHAVVLIDADLRHPAIAPALGLQSAPGLVEYLSGKAELDEIIQTDTPSGAKVIAAGKLKTDPVTLLQSPQAAAMLEALEKQFGLIVMDSSPVLAVTEPRILASMADRCALLVHWAKTPRPIVKTALNQLNDFGAIVDGVVLSRVNMRQQAHYGYGEYGYYAARMSDYYAK